MSRTASKASPRPTRATAAKHCVSYQLRELIEARGLTAYGLGQLAGVDPGVISRFLRAERTITLDTLDRLADALGLRLVEVAARGRGRPRKAGPPVASDEGDRPRVE
jgi:transcriptional regulator with XRE-family HTH domain